MKLRIRSHNLRFRLTQGEVRSLSAGQTVSEITGFPNGNSFRYSLIPSSKNGRIHAVFNNGEIGVHIPIHLISNWAQTDLVGFDEKLSISSDENLTVLIEKDFACLKPRALEEDFDAFPNPEACC